MYAADSALEIIKNVPWTRIHDIKPIWMRKRAVASVTSVLAGVSFPTRSSVAGWAKSVKAGGAKLSRCVGRTTTESGNSANSGKGNGGRRQKSAWNSDRISHAQVNRSSKYSSLPAPPVAQLCYLKRVSGLYYFLLVGYGLRAASVKYCLLSLWIILLRNPVSQTLIWKPGFWEPLLMAAALPVCADAGAETHCQYVSNGFHPLTEIFTITHPLVLPEKPQGLNPYLFWRGYAAANQPRTAT
ncbi:hypothetical protein B0H10DRAFT_1956140 [Mycena sp. CBHHK59/15]|nr:hypothetical protein B0H10DRAFT_1956140 [Mycena sp. CBHHK59/15]